MSGARLFFVGCVAFSCYFVYVAGAGALRSHRIAQDEAAAADRVRALEDDRAYVRAVLDYVSSDGYVEQEARRRLGYVADGEIAVVVSSPALGASAAQDGEWWERLFPR